MVSLNVRGLSLSLSLMKFCFSALWQRALLQHALTDALRTRILFGPSPRPQPSPKTFWHL